tara:strand:+ start:4064 stop:4516 length:453 start_codon:yes stop_codon:yes gene_type:complete
MDKLMKENYIVPPYHFEDFYVPKLKEFYVGFHYLEQKIIKHSMFRKEIIWIDKIVTPYSNLNDIATLINKNKIKVKELNINILQENKFLLKQYQGFNSNQWVVESNGIELFELILYESRIVKISIHNYEVKCKNIDELFKLLRFFNLYIG